MDRRGGRRGAPAAHLGHRRAARRVPAAGARLPDALRRGLVHGHSVDGLPARRPHPRRAADVEREVRRLHDAARSGADARAAAGDPRLALRRRPAPRRGDAPAHDPRRGTLRPRPAEPERRAAAARRAVEVRLQGDQVDRPHRPRARTAADDLEHRRARRVRLLRQRQSGRRPSALEPGDGAADRRALAAARRCRSTATPSRSPASTRGWTCAGTFERRQGRRSGPRRRPAGRG